MSYLKSLSAETLDAIERELSAKADRLWDRGCWNPDEMEILLAQIKLVRAELKLVREARTDLAVAE
jgi:hypothetical protein